MTNNAITIPIPTPPALQGRIHEDNWNFSYYHLGTFKAFISYVARPSHRGDDPEEFFALTVLKDEEVEVFQQDFADLTSVCQAMNKKYSHWQFTDLQEKQSEPGGCGSCQAH